MTATPKAKVKKAPKYEDETKALVKAAMKVHDEERTKADGQRGWSIGPKQVLTIQAAIGSASATDASGMSAKALRALANGTDVPAKADRAPKFAALSDAQSDPFCRGRGLTSILYAIATAK